MSGPAAALLQAWERPIADPVLLVAVSGLIFLLVPPLARRMRVPGMIGVILAGAVVGPNGFRLLDRGPTLVLLGTVGLLFLMFLAAVEIDLRELHRHRYRGLAFGALTFGLPQAIGTAVMLAMGYDLPTSILIGSILASHTLLAYPIAHRLGIGRSRAVTVAIGGTIVTDTLALLVLAVIAAGTRGELDAGFWLRLTVGMAAYLAAVGVGLPRLARWVLQGERLEGEAGYLFVFASLFTGAYLASVAGVEPIVGAFLVGLALNRSVPRGSPLAGRVRFVGEAVFIPFFLLSVGMLVDVRVLGAGAGAWRVMVAMTVVVTATKWLAARLAGPLFGYARDEWWTMFGLSVPQAAATLAAALIGAEIGLLDEAVLNGTILMIVVTCLLGPWVVERYGPGVAAREIRPAAPALSSRGAA